MHPTEGMGVPAFLAKLWRLVEDSKTDDLITWGAEGKSFIIQNQARFAKDLLPLNYKHNNMASFIRQLNMYGFHKITSIEQGGLKYDKDEMEFSHPYFQKGHPYLLEHIKRKIANPKQPEVEKVAPKTETVTRVLTEVKNMNRRQESLDTRFSAMKQENEALWREIAILRQKHMKQQQIVNKLIQFLVTIVQPQRSGLGSGIGKRRGQLMINEAPCKITKLNCGPIISELPDDLLDDVDSDLEEQNAESLQPQSGTEYDVNSNESMEDLGLNTADEIDINTMDLYNKTPTIVKSEREQKKSVDSELDVASSSKSSAAIITKPGSSLLIDSKASKSPLAGTDMQLNSTADQSDDVLVAGLSEPFEGASQPQTDVISNDLFSYNTKNTEDAGKPDDMTILKYNPKHAHDILRLNSVDDYSNHIDNVQNDLDSLKDLLRTDNYELDPNHLLGYKNPEQPVYLPQGALDADTLHKLFNDDVVGYEVSPSNMDIFTGDKDEQQAVANIENDLMSDQQSLFNNSLDFNEFLQNVGDD